MMMTFDEYLTKVTILDEAVNNASQALQKFPRGEMGLTPDDVKASSEFKAAKNTYDRAFRALRTFNASVPAKFKRERSRLRRSR